jgi:hypothetical protein
MFNVGMLFNGWPVGHFQDYMLVIVEDGYLHFVFHPIKMKNYFLKKPTVALQAREDNLGTL